MVIERFGRFHRRVCKIYSIVLISYSAEDRIGDSVDLDEPKGIPFGSSRSTESPIRSPVLYLQVVVGCRMVLVNTFCGQSSVTYMENS
jgi:hypothetical protein